MGWRSSWPTGRRSAAVISVGRRRRRRRGGCWQGWIGGNAVKLLERARLHILSASFQVLIGDGAAKLIMLLANTLLVRYRSVSDYAAYAMLSNAVFLGFQLACAPIARLCIAEHDRYSRIASRLLYLFAVAVVPFVY